MRNCASGNPKIPGSAPRTQLPTRTSVTPFDASASAARRTMQSWITRRRSTIEIIWPADVGDQADLGGFPSEPLLCQSAGGRHIETGEHRERTVIAAGFFLLYRDHGDAQNTANYLDDLAHGHAFFANGMIYPIRSAFLQREPVEADDVQS